MDKLEAILQKIENIEKKVEELKEEVSVIKEREGRQRRSLLTLTEIVRALQEKMTHNERQIAEVKIKTEKTSSIVEKMALRVDDTEREVRKIRLKVNTLSKTIPEKFNEIERDSEQLKSQVKTLIEENLKLKERLTVLERKVEAMYESFDKILQNLEENVCLEDKKKVQAARRVLQRMKSR